LGTLPELLKRLAVLATGVRMHKPQFEPKRKRAQTNRELGSLRYRSRISALEIFGTMARHPFPFKE
jgi:hypothetical protein